MKPRLIVAAGVVLLVAHALAIAPHYHVGSFDDDANYILVARALAHGHGLTSRLTAGLPLVAAYPPGYAALLSVLVAAFGPSFTPARALSLVLVATVYPLLWLYLTRRGVSLATRIGVGILLGLNAVLATYGTMVMAEVPFVVALLVLLLVERAWEADGAVVSRHGLAVVALCVTLLWFKEAGAGAVAGLVAWLAIRGSPRKAVALVGGTALGIAPLLIARAVAGTALIGSRYSSDLAGAAAGGIAGRITRIPGSVATYVGTAIPRSVLPYDVPAEGHSILGYTLGALHSSITPLVVLGFVIWCVRHRDAACLIVGGYFLEVLAYPFVNERRIILVLPLILTFAAIGAEAVCGAVLRLVSRRAAQVAMAALAIGALIPLVTQFDRDYLRPTGQDTSRPGGSPYMALLHGLGRPADVVETDYAWTTALFSGHRTATSAYLAPCDPASFDRAVESDAAAYLLTAALNQPGVVGSDCVLGFASTDPRAVRLYRTGRDLASVFRLLTPHETDLVAGVPVSASGPITMTPEAPQSPSDEPGTFPIVMASAAVPGGADGAATFTWTWGRPTPVSQVSLSGAGAVTGPTTSVEVDLQGADGRWATAVGAVGAVGDGQPTPYLSAGFGPGRTATALRVTVRGSGPIAVHDVHVVGSSQQTR